MAKRNRKRKPNGKQRERMRLAHILRKKEDAAEYFSELFELTELVRWIKCGLDSPGIAIQNYADKYGFDLTKDDWMV